MGVACFYHKSEQAVAQCKKCGKGICRICYDRYAKKDSEYAGLCKDCILEAGIKCKDHPTKQAVAFCDKCGKSICKDCYDTYGTAINTNAAGCFECTRDSLDSVIKDDVAGFIDKAQRKQKLTVIGGLTGGILFSVIFGLGIVMSGERNIADIIPSVAFGFIGGGLAIVGLMTVWGAICSIKIAMDKTWSHGVEPSNVTEKGLGVILVFPKTIIKAGIVIVFAPFVAINRFSQRAKQIKQAKKAMTTGNHTIQEMKDYYTYTIVSEQGDKLLENSYAQSVLKNGEQATLAELRKKIAAIISTAHDYHELRLKLAEQ